LPCQHKAAAAAPAAAPAATTRDDPLWPWRWRRRRVVGCAPAGSRYRYVTLFNSKIQKFKRKNLLFVVVIGFGALWNREEGLSLQNNQYKNNNTNDAEYS